ncbi:hypothetical protein [Methanobrevibacter sp.]|uniref:hypothetical protein n=1 Tax=Methanobrevibacter sp. TaxID=66852 RepID=UPI0038908648
MKKLVILLILLGVFLTANVVCAVDYTSLKNPANFKAFDNTGLSTKETDGRVELTVVPVNENSIKYITGNGEKIEDNIYKYTDFGYSEKHAKFGYEGYTEIVDINGEQYVVSVLFDSKMSPSEEKEFLNVITEFNKLNNLKPISV